MIFLNHENELTWNHKFQVLYFNASWMPFNQKIISMLDKIEHKWSSIVVFAIDIDYFKGLCRRFDITTIPAVIIMENGEEIKRIESMVPTPQFVAIFDDICSS